jgi:uncharacterized repeat protein (TIGR03803 family)
MPTIRLRQLLLVCAGLCFVWTCSCWARIHSTSGAQIPTYGESVLYNFCAATGCADGAMPSYGNLVLGSDGNLYGVTASGGNSAAQCGTYGCGTVFRLSPTGVFATLYAFCNKPNCSDGLFPSSLIEGSGSCERIELFKGNVYQVRVWQSPSPVCRVSTHAVF